MYGCVYVITNRAIPNLVKVGYSTREAKVRAAELDHTGVPHRYEVAFAARVDNPQEVEREVHQYLNRYAEGKEWFRCSVRTATDAIRAVCASFDFEELFPNSRSAGGSPLVPGHALRDYFPDFAADHKHDVSDAPDASPFVPGHPLRDFYK